MKVIIGYAINYVAIEATGELVSAVYTSSKTNPDDALHDIHTYMTTIRKVKKYKVSSLQPETIEEGELG